MINLKEKEAYMEKESLFVGIDVGRYSHWATFLDKQGEILNQMPFSNDQKGCDSFLKKLEDMANKIGQIPAIGAEGYNGDLSFIQSHFDKEKIIFKSIAPIRVKRYKDLLGQPVKTDPYDSYVIADFLRNYSTKLRETDIPSEDALMLKDLCRLYTSLVKDHTKYVSRLSKDLSAAFPEYISEKLFSKISGKTSLNLLAQLSSPYEISKLSVKKFTKFLKKYSKGLLGTKKAIKILSVTNSIRSDSKKNQGKFMRIKCQATVLLALKKSIDETKKQISKALTEFPETDILTSIPGIGNILAACLLSEIYPLSKFKNEASLAFYMGIAPLIKQSGKSKKHKRAYRINHKAKDAIMQIAQHSKRFNPDSEIYVKGKLEQGKKYWQAIKSLARHLTRLIFKLIETNTKYVSNYKLNFEPERGKKTA